jgi:hypothetical protein
MPIIPISGSAVAKGALVPIARVVADGTQSQYNFTNIPQGYQDLMFVVSGRITYAGDTVLNGAIGFNANVAGIMGATNIQNNATTISSSRVSSYGFSTGGFYPTIATMPFTFGSSVFHIFSYANTSTFKGYLCRSASDTSGAGFTNTIAGSWNNTAAITQLNINSSYDNWAAGSIFTLYGVRSTNQ